MASNGVAAEYFVVAELTKRGMVATLTGKNTKDIDVIAANPNTGATVLIQVKEKSLKNITDEWLMNAKIYDNQIKIGVWYVFVDLYDYKSYIISAEEMFPKLISRYDEWNKGLKKDGTPRKPDKCFYFNRRHDLLDANGNFKINNWEDLPIF